MSRVAGFHYLMFLLVASGTAFADTVVSREPGADRMTVAFSHNDYEQRQPLLDAIDNRFYAVEADVWLHRGELQISHIGFSFKGTLQELYLDPLQARVDQLGSVYGDGRTFYLWIDLKESGADLRDALRAALARYPMLSTFTDASTTPGPVTVVLTGSESSKRKYFEEAPVRQAIRDSNDYDVNDAPADNRWLWYALKWSSYIDWNGEGEISRAESTKFDALISDIHAKGRRIRFWKTPETEAFWTFALAHDVDVIGTDLLEKLRRFLEGQYFNPFRPTPISR